MLGRTKSVYVESVRCGVIDLNGFLKSNRAAFIEWNKDNLTIRTLCTAQIQALGLPVANSGLVPIENNLAEALWNILSAENKALVQQQRRPTGTGHGGGAAKQRVGNVAGKKITQTFR